MRLKPEGQQIQSKGLILLSVCVLLVTVITLNVFQLQLIDGQNNLKIASTINRSQEIIRASRGLIYDRNGQLLVSNDAVFNVYVIPSELDDSTLEGFSPVSQRLSQMFSVEASEIQQRYEKYAFTSTKKLVAERVTLISNIKFDDFLRSYEQIGSLPGVYVSHEAKRNYEDSSATLLSHILGYIGDVNSEELAQLKTNKISLDNRARIGKDGVEKFYDQTLRGEDGIKISERVLSEDTLYSWIPKSYEAGENVLLSIDSKWQEYLYKYLSKYAAQQSALGASAIIMEANTGKLRAMVNYPSFDLASFAKGISVGEFQQLLNNDSTPLLNRAIAMQIPTGSVFKIIMAAALLQEKAITPSTIYKSGCFSIGTDYTLCEADKVNYGTLDMTEAIAHSSNPYFCQATLALARKLGSDQVAIDVLDKYFSQFGLGQRSGVDLPGEQSGAIPSVELKQKLLGEAWYLADLCNTAIGQGLVTATPLQMAVATAAVINGGKVYRPSVLEKIVDNSGQTIQTYTGEVKNTLSVNPEYLSAIRKGMQAAVDYGSAKGLNNSPGSPLAKTGSSEDSVRLDSGRYITGANSWLVGSFTKDGVEYVYAVAIQFGGRGYKSVPVIKDFLECLYSNFGGCV